MPYARNLHLTLKAGKEQEFRGVMDREVVPVLKKQGGFQEELALVGNGHAMGITVWDTKEHAQRYETLVLPKVMEHLRSILDGQPRVELFEVATRTLHP
jgi:hypothetical protein